MRIIFSIVFLGFLYLLVGFILSLFQRKSQAKSPHVNKTDYVDSGIYDSDYYLCAYSGDSQKYISSLENLPISLGRCFNLADPKTGEKILDLGCGRGHLAYHCVNKGCTVTAIDYSADAVKLANETKNALPEKIRDKMRVLKMDFRNLSDTESYDVIFMADLIEHLYDWQINELFVKMKKILNKDTGRIVIHTAPNRLFINVIFPLKRILNWPNILLQKKDFFYHRDKYSYDPEMHVNEQTPHSLKKHLKDFKAKVWCDDGSANVISLLTKSFAGADIWAVAKIK